MNHRKLGIIFNVLFILQSLTWFHSFYQNQSTDVVQIFLWGFAGGFNVVFLIVNLLDK